MLKQWRHTHTSSIYASFYINTFSEEIVPDWWTDECQNWVWYHDIYMYKQQRDGEFIYELMNDVEASFIQAYYVCTFVIELP